MATAPINYAALAAQHNGTPDTPAPAAATAGGSSVDYAALAAKHGGTPDTSASTSTAPAARSQLTAPILMARHDGWPDDQTLDYIGKFKPELLPEIQKAKSQGQSSKEILDAYAGEPADEPHPDTPVSDYFKGLIGNTAKGLYATVHRLAAGPNPDDKLDQAAYAVGGPLGPLVKDAIEAHIATGKKAIEAWRDPGTSIPEALGYTGATLLPVLGPAAAAIGEKAGAGHVAEAAGDATALLAGGPAGKLAGKLAGAAVPALAETGESLYRSALKPSTTLEPAEATNLVKTGLENRIPISAGGLTKLNALISDLSAKVNAKIDAGNQAGVTVDPAAVATRVDSTRARFASQVDPEADIAAIDATKQRYLDRNSTPATPPTTLYGPNNQPMQVGGSPAVPKPIPAKAAMGEVRGTYQKLKGSYGELSGAQTEAVKALARGTKEELQAQFPELKSLTEKQWQFLQLEPELERAVNRIANHEPLGLIPATAMDAAAAAHGAGAGAAAGLIAKLVTNPRIRARLAMGLDMAAKANPSAGVRATAKALPTAAQAGAQIGSQQRIKAFLAALQAASGETEAAPATGGQ